MNTSGKQVFLVLGLFMHFMVTTPKAIRCVVIHKNPKRFLIKTVGIGERLVSAWLQICVPAAPESRFRMLWEFLSGSNFYFLYIMLFFQLLTGMGIRYKNISGGLLQGPRASLNQSFLVKSVHCSGFVYLGINVQF